MIHTCYSFRSSLFCINEILMPNGSLKVLSIEINIFFGIIKKHFGDFRMIFRLQFLYYAGNTRTTSIHQIHSCRFLRLMAVLKIEQCFFPIVRQKCQCKFIFHLSIPIFIVSVDEFVEHQTVMRHFLFGLLLSSFPASAYLVETIG